MKILFLPNPTTCLENQAGNANLLKYAAARRHDIAQNVQVLSVMILAILCQGVCMIRSAHTDFPLVVNAGVFIYLEDQRLSCLRICEVNACVTCLCVIKEMFQRSLNASH